jgi:hypothetical protein
MANDVVDDYNTTINYLIFRVPHPSLGRAALRLYIQPRSSNSMLRVT